MSETLEKLLDRLDARLSAAGGDAINRVLGGEPRTTAVTSLRDHEVMRRLRSELAAGAVQLKLRYEGFDTITRQAPLDHQVRDAEPLYELGVSLLRAALAPDRAVRLIGLTAINLAEWQQLTLFDAPDETDRITQSIDAVRARFGERAITRARLIGHRDHRKPDFGMRPDSPLDEGLDK